MGKIAVFEVVKPQGIKGLVKAKILADDITSVSGLKKLYIGETEYALSGIKDAGGGFAFLSIKGLSDRNAAELMRGKVFSADKSAIVKSVTAMFIEDIIGLTALLTDGEILGKITDVIKSNVDMFLIEGENGAIYVPYLKKLNPEINEEKKTITFDKDAAQEVIYREN